MTKDNTFESLTFHSIINTILSKRYPEHFPMHWHKYIELIAIPYDEKKNLKGTIKINQEQYELHGGDFVLIWPGELHEVVDNEDKAFIALQFPMKVLSDIKDFAICLNLYKKKHFYNYEDSPEQNERIFFSLKQIFQVSTEYERNFRNVEMLMHLYDMFICLGNDLLKNAKQANNTLNQDEKILAACAYIQENCDTNITLDSVAKHIGFSPCYFSRYFKKVTSYSFVEYLMMQRVNRLQVLLTDDSLSITDAAYQAGFKSISTLNRVFKQYSGCSPTEYKKYYKV
ncbi:MAG: AraC family transcriptional regulator [Eubacteriales bacterium]|nr:AraC family transcriptional regulator [Eubacteriales bacterium]